MIRPDTLEQGEPELEQEMEVSRSSPAEEGPPQMDIPSEMQPSVGDPGGPPQLSPAQERPEADPRPPPRKHQGGGYECKYCPFSTQNINEFKEHVDANHPNVILNPLYLCAVCNFNTKKFDTLTEHNERFHPGESNFKFKRVKLNNQTILEQTIEGSSNAVTYNAGGTVSGADIATFPLSKSTTVKIGKPKTDNKRILPESQVGKLTLELSKKQITAVNVNGTVLIPEASLKDGLHHIMPSLQRPPNYNLVPKIAVPLNTSKYNPSLDGNLTLITSFNKFPYPTHAELSWLTAASKHPEEQIKVWFTTQRLKQGISWSPEEVEEARKKMFNGTIQSVPRTFTVLPTQLAPQSGKAPQTLLHTVPCQVLGQTSLVLTPVANGSTVTCAPIALTLANQVAQSVKRPLASPVVVATEIKRPSIIQAVQTAAKIVAPKLSFTTDSNKTADQLAVLKASYTQCQFPEEEEVYRLIENTGLSRGEIKKWFSEQRLLNLRGAPQGKAELPAKEGPAKITIPTHFPLLERVKGKSSEQLKMLEESFQKSGLPTEAEVGQLVENTRLSKTEIDCWFSERRALRDNLEQALLNSLAPKVPEDHREVLNGVHEQQENKIPASPPTLPPPPLSASTSPQPIDSTLLGLLKEVFSQTQWPSPEEYNRLEVQTAMARTDIVRWFKDNRSALKNGTLEWMDQFQNLVDKRPNSPSSSASSERSPQPSPAKLLKLEEEADKMPERSKLQPVSNQDIVQWFTNKLGQSMSDLSRAREQAGQAAVERGRWVKVTMAVGGEEGKGLDMQRLVPEADVLAVDHPGRVTG